MERKELITCVEERIAGDVYVSARVLATIVEATIATLFDAEQLNAKRCPCCRTRIATVTETEPLAEVA